MRIPSLRLALVGAFVACNAAANSFSVTPDVSSGNFNTFKWTIVQDGGTALSNPTLTLIVGQTYTFTANTNAIHPFYIKTVQETGSAGAYPTGGSSGLDNNGVTSSSTPMTFTPPASAAGTLFYNCGNHASMTGTIKVIVDPIFASNFE